MGTLINKRRALRDLERAIESMKVAEVFLGDVEEAQYRLANETLIIPVPCTVCEQSFPVNVTVGGHTIPTAVLCRACDDAAATPEESE